MGFVPIDAAIGDALSIDEWLAWYEFLRSRDQIALDHDAEDAAVSRGNLCGDIAAHEALTSVVLVAVGVAAVDHDARGDAGTLHERCSFGNARCDVVHRIAAAAEDDVAIWVTCRHENG